MGYRMRVRTPYNTLYPFERNVITTTRYNPTNGWEGTGQGIAFTFQLRNLIITFGNGTGQQIPMPASNELSSLFDHYRIDRIDMQGFWAYTQLDGTTGTNTLTNRGMPLITIVNDYNDNNVAAGTTNLLEYSQSRTMYFNSQGVGLTHNMFKPGVSVDANVGSQGQSQPALVRRSPWIDTVFPEVNHFGIKCQAYPIPNFSPNENIGAMTWKFKIYYSCKNSK